MGIKSLIAEKFLSKDRVTCYIIIFLFTFQALGISVLHADGPRGEDIFNKGLESYRVNEFYNAISLFEKAITELLGQDAYRDTLKEAYMYLGRCLVISNNEEKAKEAFRNALEIDPSLSMDIMRDPPKIIGIFEEARAIYKKEQQDKKQLVTLEKSMTEEPAADSVRKPWYKKWWVWGVSAAVVGGAAVALSSSSSSGSGDDGETTIRITWGP
ncbi:tetratricopeptide repeat protein [candidate division CSSED10-310 bacterium]|uniref:Tetratricopeptide repeat protein n=1 Tax=candidate division CSSED10-310 bacterium TaxID=2855610 RepID=A0ABV6YUF7_UNCC1